MHSLADLLRRLIHAHGGSHRDFAKAVGLTGSTLSHILSGDRHYSIGIEPCLRIASVTHTSASTILRAAGKAAVADLLETLYGEPAAKKALRRPAALTPHDVRLIRQLRALDVKRQRAFALLIEYHFAQTRSQNRSPRSEKLVNG